MTVQEMINILNNIQDKNKPLVIETYSYNEEGEVWDAYETPKEIIEDDSKVILELISLE